MYGKYFGIQVCPNIRWVVSGSFFFPYVPYFWLSTPHGRLVEALGDGRTIMRRDRLPKDVGDGPDPKLLLISEGFRMIVLANRGLVGRVSDEG